MLISELNFSSSLLPAPVAGSVQQYFRSKALSIERLAELYQTNDLWAAIVKLYR